MPATEAVFTIAEPGCITFAQACRTLNMPVTFMFMTREKSSILYVNVGHMLPWYPALFHKKSIRPKAAMILATASFTLLRSATFPLIFKQSLVAGNEASASSLRSIAQTFAPNPRNLLTAHDPKYPAPPVITTTLSLNCDSMKRFASCRQLSFVVERDYRKKRMLSPCISLVKCITKLQPQP